MEKEIEELMNVSLTLWQFCTDYIQKLTVNELTKEELSEDVSCQAIEVWSTIFDKELELSLQDEAEADQKGVNTALFILATIDQRWPSQVNAGFLNKAQSNILPVLLNLLTKQEEGADEDDWTVSMAAATCLSLLCQCAGDLIVSNVYTFVENNIRDNNSVNDVNTINDSGKWRRREAAAMAFQSMLNGPSREVLAPLIQRVILSGEYRCLYWTFSRNWEHWLLWWTTQS